MMKYVPSQMLQVATATFAIALIASLATAEPASEVQTTSYCGEPTCSCENGCCGDACCTDCGQKCCVATVEKETVEKHCWKVERKEVCVPKVVLPWQEGGSGLTLFSCLKKDKGGCCGDTCCCNVGCSDGCCEGATCCCMKPRCGKVKCVRDIKKETYECEECVCKWEIRRLPPCCDDCGCCDGCGDTCCGDACGCASLPKASDIQLTGATTYDLAQPVAQQTTTSAQSANAAESASKPSWGDRLMFWK